MCRFCEESCWRDGGERECSLTDAEFERAIEDFAKEVHEATLVTSLARYSHYSREDWLRHAARALNGAAGESADFRDGVLIGVNDSLTVSGFAPTTFEELESVRTLSERRPSSTSEEA